MKIFLSALENAEASKGEGGQSIAQLLINRGVRMQWNLMSFFYIRTQQNRAELIRENTNEILIDSGTHSFQKGKKVDWERYTDEYAAFIRRFDRPNVIGYFEMDVDNVIGYDRVLSLRKRLEAVTDKIIPVWHKNRGVDDFKAMCQHYSGKIVAVTGFKNEDIKDDQYLMFLKYAREHGCKVHCLGMTRRKVLDKVPFDYADSSTWVQSVLFGSIGGKKITRDYSSKHRGEAMIHSYCNAIEMQRRYYKKWQCECHD